ncbi:MAG: hypothetical protein HOP28_14310 [Gemmatimonadales bacterium]|nr:hypothetical protein [Gemmatimonadales bacterium]
MPASFLTVWHLTATLVMSYPAPQGCQPVSPAHLLVDVGQVLDSAGLLRRLGGPDTRANPPIVSVFLSKPPTAHVVDAPPEATPPDSLIDQILASLRPDSKDPPAAFRVRVQYAPAPAVTVEPAILCGPVVVKEGKAPTPMRRVVREGERPRDITPRPVVTRIRIGTTGNVLRVDISSGSGYPEIDRNIQSMVQSRSYRPALLDGRPVEVWLTGDKVELVR